MVAPAAEGQFGVNITMNSWKKAMQAVGFNGFVEVALGGDMTAAYELMSGLRHTRQERRRLHHAVLDL